LHFDPGIRKAEKHFAGTIAAKLSAERARHYQILAGEGIHSGGNVTRTLFAGDDVMRRLDLPLLAVVHRHWRRIGEYTSGGKGK
jgi:hypothetical protein